MRTESEAAQVEELESLRTKLKEALAKLEMEQELHSKAQNQLESAESKLTDTLEALRVAEDAIRERDQYLTITEGKLAKTEESLAVAHHKISYLERHEMTSPVERERESFSETRRPSLSRSNTRRASGTKSPGAGDEVLNFTSTPNGAPPARRHSSKYSTSGGMPSRQNSLTRARLSITSAVESFLPQMDTSLFSIASMVGTDNPASETNTVGMVPEEEHRHALVQLERETQAREVLEEEVSRLRHIAMDYKAQLESIKRAGSASPPISTGSHESSGAMDKTNREKNSVSPLLAKRERQNSRRNISQGKGPPIAAVVRGQSQVLNSQWSKAWDDEDNDDSGSSHSNTETNIRSSFSSDMMHPGASDLGAPIRQNPLANTGSSGIANAQRNNLDAPVDVSSAVATFEKNLESFRSKMKQGIKVHVWEGMKISNAEVFLKLDATNRLLSFDDTHSKRGFGLFHKHVDVAPIGLSEISECLPGAEIELSSSDQSLLLSIVAKMDDLTASARLIAVKFVSRDQRNTVLAGLRSLMAETQINTSAIMSNVPDKINTRSNSGKTGTHSNPMRALQGSRRLSVGEAVLEEKHAQSVNPAARSARRGNAPTIEKNTKNDEDVVAVVVEDLHKQLHHAKKQNERMMLQLVVVTNDLTERDEQIALLKKKEEHYEQTLAERDNMYKQDAMVRMQLGKRLEQVLMDKEEALEKFEQMKLQLESLRQAFT